MKQFILTTFLLLGGIVMSSAWAQACKPADCKPANCKPCPPGCCVKACNPATAMASTTTEAAFADLFLTGIAEANPATVKPAFMTASKEKSCEPQCQKSEVVNTYYDKQPACSIIKAPAQNCQSEKGSAALVADSKPAEPSKNH